MTKNARGLKLLGSYAVAASVLGGVAWAQPSKSSAVAKEVAQLMTQQQMQYVAAKEPSEPDRFVAALQVPGMGLLVISGKYSAPSLLTERVMARGYQDVYSDLQGAATAGSKVFVTDLGGDGLVARPENNQPADTYDVGTVTTFDGDWKRAKLTEEAYAKTFADADARYSAMLQALLKELKRKPT